MAKIANAKIQWIRERLDTKVRKFRITTPIFHTHEFRLWVALALATPRRGAIRFDV